MFRLFAFQSARVSVVIVKQPTDTLFRTTHGVTVSTVAASTTPTRIQRRRFRPTRNAQQTIGRKRRRVFPRIASAEQRAEDGAEPERPPLPEREHAEHDRGREQLVEDLAVLVDVVPDEVRVERRDDGRDHAGLPRDEAPPDLVDEQRGRDGDADLEEPDRPPASGRRSSRSGSGSTRRAAASTRSARRG